MKRSPIIKRGNYGTISLGASTVYIIHSHSPHHIKEVSRDASVGDYCVTSDDESVFKRVSKEAGMGWKWLSVRTEERSTVIAATKRARAVERESEWPTRPYSR